MTLHLLLMDLANYSVQIAAVIVVGSAAPLLLRIRKPDILLVYRQTLLAACLLLPFLQSWNHPAIDSSVDVSVGVGTVTQSTSHANRRLNLDELAALLLCAGMLARLCWLGIGFARLNRYRNRAEGLIPPPPVFGALQRRLCVWPSICLSNDVSSPVTFGIREPVILLPPAFLAMPSSAQEAIACHELTHVRRRDWAVAMLEELIRAVLWFHPAVWWLLGQIQLSREQTVDAQVIRITESREQYIDALLAVAGGHLQPDLEPAPLFLRKTQLAQRVALIVKEVSMSKRRLLSSFAAIGGALVITARFAVLYFPISAPAQEIVKGGDNLLHRAPLEYPADAIEKGIQGTVVVAATLNERGVVTDARAISGPDPLRKAALKSVLDWHYAAQTQSPVEVAVDFKLPVRAPASASVPETGRLKRIMVAGISPPLREAVTSRLPVQVGDFVQPDTLQRVKQAVREMDEHLDARFSSVTTANNEREYALRVYSNTPMEVPATGVGPQRIRVGANVVEANLLSAPQPVYPPLAKQARVQGAVKLDAIIGKDGTIVDLRAASGHPLLVPAALEAVRQWVYKPTLLNGSPVEVVTVIDVNFTLSQ